MRVKTAARMPRPLIIGHNCGFIGYNKNPYSRAATLQAYKDCDYLEIDLKLEREGGEEKWWYFHDGILGEGNRKYGASFDDFLTDFRFAERKWSKKLAASKVKLKPGIFLDLKECLKSQTEVYGLMDYLNEKYKKGLIPEGTPLMIFTGRGTPRPSVYKRTTLYFVKWLAQTLLRDFRRECAIMKRRFCPRLTLVTREIKGIKKQGLAYWKGILGPFRKSCLKDREISWFGRNLGKTFWWAFNPELFWLLRYEFAEIIENEIAVIPWFETNLSKLRNLRDWMKRREKASEADMASSPLKLKESYSGWIKVILGVLGEYWLYKSSHRKDVRPLRWGFITFAPNLLKDALKKYSIPARLVRQGQL